ncbi:hypothetical protein Q31b_14560 [Novipirellula aureliae]|uniref:O-Antigen ligase n=1 Tax=Novipirellula aureliae TaxID=2527966 RepID=A0A5C6E5U5_9BACT|nr:hypothetical protein [Novipirellula aureliae]TWU43924.1 hypothetical protein Q31b_14560 [Novipirellula aureliae]
MNFPLLSVFAVVTVVCLFGFPKAGVYLGDIPITFGYLLLGVTGGIQLIRLAANSKRRIRPEYAALGLLFFLLSTVELAGFSQYGYASKGALISIVVSTIIVPVLSLLSIHYFIDILGTPRFLKLLRISLLIVFGFGVLSFVVYNTTHIVIGIPFLTTTGADIHLVAERHNLRGSMIKMFSTYNNGNILGVNLLIWGPIAAIGAAGARFQFRSICILTLSRSVWIGFAAYEFVNAVVQRKIARIFYAGAFVLVLFAIFVGASYVMGREPFAFLLDSNLGGRVSNFRDELHGMGTQKLAWTSESLYLAAYLTFGWMGVALITLIWLLPIVFGGRSPIEIQSRIVLAIYLFIASSEAAFNLIPTQAVYWMVAGLALGAAGTKPDEIDDEWTNLPNIPHRDPSADRPHVFE